MRLFLFSQNTYAECYFVTEATPPPSLVESGKGNNVSVLSFRELQARFIDYDRYAFVRSAKSFGSAIDPFSGEKDTREYVPVKYRGIIPDREFSLDDICEAILRNQRIVLLGSFGSGKSRCIQEVFGRLSQAAANNGLFPIAIDLRHHWGARRAHELIRRHCDEIGLSGIADNIVKVLDHDRLAFLVDGFDEIASQAWSDDPLTLQTLRAQSLSAVKDLVQNTKGPIIITGREHYFNSKEEMYSCLGLSEGNVLLIECADQFTTEQVVRYLNIIKGSITVPEWLPRRPLICQILASLSPEDLDHVLSEGYGEAGLWRTLIRVVCEREAKINPALDPTTIHLILMRLARLARSKSGDVGPVSVKEFNRVFEDVTGRPPANESAAMLQRLPILGRVGAESTDRQFVDLYFLDGLRADDLSTAIYLQREEVLTDKWFQPLRRLGLSVFGDEMATAPEATVYYRYLKGALKGGNSVLACDIIASRLFVRTGEERADFGGVAVRNGRMFYLNLAGKSAMNLALYECVIDAVDLFEANVSNVTLAQCAIGEVEGITDLNALPAWITDCAVDSFLSVSTVTRIKQAPLTPQQRIVVTIIKKTFFQPGAGRKEEALIRGLGQEVAEKDIKKILHLLEREGILTKFRGSEGLVYAPQRHFTKRMGDILRNLTLSDDPIWKSLK